MNQKEITLSQTEQRVQVDCAGKIDAVLRKILIKVLSQASEGHFVLKEHGRVIASVEPASDASADSSKDVISAEVNIVDTRVYARALLGGNTAAGEAFVDGWWTSPDITQVTRFFARNLSMMDYWGSRFGWLLEPFALMRRMARANSKAQAKRNILAHYDLGNGLYQSFLDERMQYSSAIFHQPDESLGEAQVNKLTRICEQLRLSEEDHLLEVGTGWGGLALFAAEHYGCRVTTTTISDRQHAHASEQVRKRGLGDRITVLDQDYRLLTGEYDKIVSVEMIEAVGKKYLPGFFRKLDSLLKPNGLLMLQAITIADQRFKDYSRKEDFIQKHVFPGGFLPSMAQMGEIIAGGTEMVIRDVLDIGIDYARTLAHWRERFLDRKPLLQSLGYDEKFCNLWLYYLGYCEGGFLERRVSAVQILASKAPHR